MSNMIKNSFNVFIVFGIKLLCNFIWFLTTFFSSGSLHQNQVNVLHFLLFTTEEMLPSWLPADLFEVVDQRLPYEWYFRFKGYRVIEQGVGKKETVEIDGLDLVKYPIVYFVKTEDIYHVASQNLKKISISASVKKG